MLRRNECINPSVETDAALWSYSWFGTGTGTNARMTDGGLNGSGYLRKTFSTTSNESGDVGFSYQHDGWSGDWTEKIASAYLRPVNIDGYGRVTLQSYNKDGGLISRQDGNPQYLGNTVWTRISDSFKCPPGTTTSKVSFWMVSGRQLGAGFRLDLDSAFIEPGNVLGSYFDGDTYGNGNGTQYTTWAGTHHASQSYLWDADPATQLRPAMVLGYDVGQQSRNIIHQLIDGPVAATLLPASTRQGVLKLFFEDAASAENARAKHATAGTWYYLDTDQPQEAMWYAVNGTVRKYQSDNRKRWILEVPYNEVS